mmetsp:Transcript_2531/g.9705  ORF Transcript_2531/g.9705 Transcript_2531/m.9705 type:complete len:1030 (-) Transcript_2531:19-3108(-)
MDDDVVRRHRADERADDGHQGEAVPEGEDEDGHEVGEEGFEDVRDAEARDGDAQDGRDAAAENRGAEFGQRLARAERARGVARLEVGVADVGRRVGREADGDDDEEGGDVVEVVAVQVDRAEGDEAREGDEHGDEDGGEEVAEEEDEDDEDGDAGDEHGEDRRARDDGERLVPDEAVVVDDDRAEVARRLAHLLPRFAHAPLRDAARDVVVLPERVDLGRVDAAVVDEHLVGVVDAVAGEIRPERREVLLARRHRLPRLVEPALVRVEPVRLERGGHDVVLVGVVVDEAAHVVAALVVVGALGVQADPLGRAAREVLLLEVEPLAHVVVAGHALDDVPVVFDVHADARRPDDGHREDDGRRAQHEDPAGPREQHVGVRPAPEVVVLDVPLRRGARRRGARRRRPGRLGRQRRRPRRRLVEVSRVIVVVVDGLGLDDDLRRRLDRRDLRRHVGVGGVVHGRAARRVAHGALRLDAAPRPAAAAALHAVAGFLRLDLGELPLEPVALVVREERDEERQLEGKVDHDGRRAEAVEVGDVGRLGERAADEGGGVGDGGHRDRRPRRAERVDDAPRRDRLDRLAVHEDAVGVVLERRPRRVVPLFVEVVVDEPADDERVVEADAEHEEDRDARRRREPDARQDSEPKGGERRDDDREHGVQPDDAARALGPLAVVEREEGVRDDDEDGDVDEEPVAVERRVRVRVDAVLRHGNRVLEVRPPRAANAPVELVLEAPRVRVGPRALVERLLEVEGEPQRAGARDGAPVGGVLQFGRDRRELDGARRRRAAIFGDADVGVDRRERVGIGLEPRAVVRPEREDRLLLAQQVGRGAAIGEDVRGPEHLRAAPRVVPARVFLRVDRERQVVEVEELQQGVLVEEVRLAVLAVQVDERHRVGVAEAILDPVAVGEGARALRRVQLLDLVLVVEQDPAHPAADGDDDARPDRARRRRRARHGEPRARLGDEQLDRLGRAQQVVPLRRARRRRRRPPVGAPLLVHIVLVVREHRHLARVLRVHARLVLHSLLRSDAVTIAASR